MSRLDDINTELCGLGIEMIQNKEMDQTAINVDPVYIVHSPTNALFTKLGKV